MRFFISLHSCQPLDFCWLLCLPVGRLLQCRLLRFHPAYWRHAVRLLLLRRHRDQLSACRPLVIPAFRYSRLRRGMDLDIRHLNRCALHRCRSTLRLEVPVWWGPICHSSRIQTNSSAGISYRVRNSQSFMPVLFFLCV